MGIIFILIPLSILLAVIALVGFAYSAKSGQFDDLDTP
ncbi:MAG: cbb3-type cytochrome oxidase assembly protein CcoS, partial [Bdellovibrionales bacterium]|nr:cbb3-type cytochrome oxidase assembly protein CcoS [Bdellovibrionales bacterium]